MLGERRRFDHVPLAVQLTVVDQAANKRYHGCSTNLSRGGVGFYLEHYIQPGTPVEIVFHISCGSSIRTERVEAVIRWSHVEGEGALIGAAFVQLLSDSACPLVSDKLFAAL